MSDYNVFKPSTLPAASTGKAVAQISVNRAGLFSISKDAIYKLGLAALDRVLILQDKEDPREIRIAPIGKTGDGFLVHQTRGKYTVYHFGSAQLRKKILAACYEDRDFNGTFRLIVGGESQVKVDGHKYRAWALLPKPIV